MDDPGGEEDNSRARRSELRVRRTIPPPAILYIDRLPLPPFTAAPTSSKSLRRTTMVRVLLLLIDVAVV